MLSAHLHLPLLFAVSFLSPSPSFAQLDVITSVGFVAADNVLVPAFQKSSGITVATEHFASQGDGPDTIAVQLRAGAAADVVIMSKEGLGELVAEGRIIRASAVDLAQVQLGVAVRAGAPKPDIYFDLPNRTVQRKKLTAGSHRGEPYGRAHAVREDLVV
jgi:molybdate transport system substrate-binding protein